MLSFQLLRREALLDRRDAALDRWADRSAQGFKTEMTAVAEALQALAEEVDAGNGELLERSRNWRFTGYTYFELADGKDRQLLTLAAKAYSTAAALLNGTNSPMDEMKLNYLFGHTLLNLSEGKNPGMLQEARSCFVTAREAARIAQPASIRDAEEGVATVDQIIGLVTKTEQLGQHIEKLRKEKEPYDKPPVEDNITVSEIQGWFGILMEEYNKDISAGKVSDTRQQVLNPLLSQLEGLVFTETKNLEESQNRRSKVGELHDQLEHLLADTSHGTPRLQENSRANKVWKLFSNLKLFLANELARPQIGYDEHSYGMEIYQSCGRVDTLLHNPAPDDIKARKFEIDMVRKLAGSIRVFLRRNHLTLISPIWSSATSPENPNAVFFSGTDALKKVVEVACSSHDLRLLATASLRDYGSERWDQLRTCNVAIFDFTGYQYIITDKGLNNAPRTDIFGVSYELGIALTLGKPIIVLAAEDQQVPFDVDIKPVVLKNDDSDTGLLIHAIDHVVYGIQRGGRKIHTNNNSAIGLTHAYLKEKFSKSENIFIEQSLKQIGPSATRDPVRFRRSIESLLGSAGPGAPYMVFPSWPGSYPVASSRLCFHVMPYGPPWAPEVMETVAQACNNSSKPTEYVRGDQVTDPDIIVSIWDYLCKATHIVVDLTGCSANVALELGIAHTLGRNVLLVTQDNINHPPSISKMRIHKYSATGWQGLHSLSNIITQFLLSP